MTRGSKRKRDLKSNMQKWNDKEEKKRYIYKGKLHGNKSDNCRLCQPELSLLGFREKIHCFPAASHWLVNVELLLEFLPCWLWIWTWHNRPAWDYWLHSNSITTAYLHQSAFTANFLAVCLFWPLLFFSIFLQNISDLCTKFPTAYRCYEASFHLPLLPGFQSFIQSLPLPLTPPSSVSSSPHLPVQSTAKCSVKPSICSEKQQPTQKWPSNSSFFFLLFKWNESVSFCTWAIQTHSDTQTLCCNLLSMCSSSRTATRVRFKSLFVRGVVKPCMSFWKVQRIKLLLFFFFAATM